MEIGQVLAGSGNGFDFVLDQNIHDTVGALNGHRTDLFGGEHTQPAAFDHGGAAHAQIGVFRGDDDIADARKRRITSKTPPRNDRHHRRAAAVRRHQAEGM